MQILRQVAAKFATYFFKEGLVMKRRANDKVAEVVGAVLVIVVVLVMWVM